MHEVSFSFDDTKEVFPKTSMGSEVGQIVVLRPSPAFGKRTFLLLVARTILPREGFIFYSQGWRVCYIDAVPAPVDASLM